MHIVDVFVQSAAAYALTLTVVAIATVVLVTSRNNFTVPMLAVIDYGTGVILLFVSVRTFGV